MSATPMRAISRGLIGTTAVLAAGLSGFYMRGSNTTTKLSNTASSFVRSYSSSSSSAAAPFTYRLAAAASGKRSPPRPSKPGRDYWIYSTTHQPASQPYIRSSKPDSGEDAFFMATVGGSPHSVAFGVADGVGGWQDQGVDPSDFSHGLCGLMAGTAHLHGAEGEESQGKLKPRELMQTAYDAVMGNPRIVAGGCTASLGVLDGQGELEAAKYVLTSRPLIRPIIDTTRTALATPASSSSPQAK